MRRRRKTKAAAPGPSLSDLRERTKKHLNHKSHTPKDVGNREFKARNFEAAVEAYSLAISAEKKDPTLYSNRSAAYCALGKFGKALNDAKTALAMDPKWPKAYFRLGYAEEKMSQFADALAHYTEGLKLCATTTEKKFNNSAAKSKRKSAADENKHKGMITGKPTCREMLGAAVERVRSSMETLRLDQRIEADTKDPFFRMVAWLKEGGATFPELYMRRYRNDHRGVHALSDIDPQKEILYVPLKFIMTSEMAKSSSIGKSIAAAKVEVESSHTWLAAFLLSEKSRKQSSFFHPYISILPETFTTIPLFFKQDLLDELKGSFSLEKIDRRNEHLKKEFETIAAKVPEFKKFGHDAFVWARLVVITRIFGIVVDNVKTDGLVPYADMLNHKLPRDTAWAYQDQLKGFTINTCRPIKMGEEVFDSYGRKCNHRFFVNYGFALTENEDNEAVMTVRLQSTDPEASRKARIFQNLLVHPYHERGYQVPAKYEQKTRGLFGFLRLCKMNTKELMAFAGERKMIPQDADTLLENILPRTKRNELLVLEELKKAAQTSMSAFSTTIETDEKLLKNKEYKSLNHRNCIVMRLGEKKVLQWFIDLANRATRMLRYRSFLSFASEAKAIMHQDPEFDVYVEQVLEPLAIAESILL